jgi:hypothetical protein
LKASPAPIPAPARFDSAIVPQIPSLFADFGRKHFNLLWRGGRDGFRADQFHRRCDGHANTLTQIEDTGGNIFGGFAPVEWESPVPANFRADPSLNSFLFTLKNPRNVPARKFGLRADQKDEAIDCDPSRGPHFCDIQIYCNADSYTSVFGHSYANGTGVDGQTFFTGSLTFKVKEIEVFAITD